MDLPRSRPAETPVTWRPRAPGRSLAQVRAFLGLRGAGRDVELTGVVQDSRAVAPGDLYVALPGARHHGADHAEEAAALGAVAVLSDRAPRHPPGAARLPVLLHPDPRAVLGPLAAWFHREPSAAMDLYGVTGTNGKTSTAHLLEAGLTGAGARTGLLSGVVQRGPHGARPVELTTPEATELAQVLARLREQGVTAAALEVSSHALALRRVDGTRFRAAVFTNLGRDHLDLHGDLEAYLAAKARLFEAERCALAVVSVDDDAGRRLAEGLRVPLLTTSAAGTDADWRAEDVRASAHGTAFRLRGPGVDRAVRLALLGAHQVDNALGALAALAGTGVDLDAALGGVQRLAGVPGRLERVDAGQPFLALVDHVHNPHGQQRLFPYLRSLTTGGVHVVLGATGGRDRGKRRPLGELAAVHADTVVVTDESPYDDDPAALRDEVAAGARAAGAAHVLVEADRAAAIELAVSRAAPGDVLVVAGRGHGSTLVRGGVSSPFDDRVVLAAALRRALAAA